MRRKRLWSATGRDPERLQEAVTDYRDESGPTIRPARRVWVKGQPLR